MFRGKISPGWIQAVSPRSLAVFVMLGAALLVAAYAGAAPMASMPDEALPPGVGIVHLAQSAPIIPDGDVASSVTDIVIDLDSALDPSIPGRTLLEGKSIRITLPDEFINSEDLPLADVGSENCVPGNLLCSTGVLLQGWPQHPISPGKYTLSYDGPNTIVYTANEDLIPDPPLEPGIKRAHLILRSFTNPDPGTYLVEVEAETGPEGEVESGVALLEIRDSPRPSINVTSVFNEGTPNTIYQEAGAEELTPLPYDFLLWDWDGAPMEGVTITEFEPDRWLLTQGGRVVGTVTVDAPEGATGQSVSTEGPSVEIKAPVLGIATARLTAFFETGSESGDYIVTFSLLDGNSAQMTVHVE